MAKKIIHYREDCIGCGLCALLAEEDWEMSEEDGKAYLKDSIEKNGIFTKDIPDDRTDQNEEAAKQCPVNIIKVS